MCFAQSKYRVCCFCLCFLLKFFFFKHYRPGTVTVSFSAVSNGLLVISTIGKKKNLIKIVILIENMKGDRLAYVAYCCFELATESF